jgi:hypothetical protein
MRHLIFGRNESFFEESLFVSDALKAQRELIVTGFGRDISRAPAGKKANHLKRGLRGNVSAVVQAQLLDQRFNERIFGVPEISRGI